MDRINNLIDEFADDLFEALYGDANDPDGTPYKDTYVYEIQNIFEELQKLVDLEQKITLEDLMKKLFELERNLIGNIRIVSENLDDEKLEEVAEKIENRMSILLG